MEREIAGRITFDPQFLVGKPVIRGTRSPVVLVLVKLASNPSPNALFLDYPELTVDDAKATLRYVTTKA